MQRRLLLRDPLGLLIREHREQRHTAYQVKIRQHRHREIPFQARFVRPWPAAGERRAAGAAYVNNLAIVPIEGLPGIAIDPHVTIRDLAAHRPRALATPTPQ